MNAETKEKDKKPERIVIIGISGAGKSTLGKKLAAVYDLPLVHMDFHFWKPGWVEPEKEKWHSQVRKLCAGPFWIMEGNYTSTFEMRFSRADLIIWMDFNRYTALWRACKRTFLNYGQNRPDLPEGCPERFSWSFLVWIWKFPESHRARTEAALARHASGTRVVRLSSAADVRRFFDELKSARGPL